MHTYGRCPRERDVVECVRKMTDSSTVKQPAICEQVLRSCASKVDGSRFLLECEHDLGFEDTLIEADGWQEEIFQQNSWHLV